jgi:hypothetical protein
MTRKGQGLKERLRRFLKIIVYSEAGVAAKFDRWLNAGNHCRGYYTCFPDPDHPGYVRAHQAERGKANP